MTTTIRLSYLRLAGVVLCSTLLLFGCAKNSVPDEEPVPVEPTENGQLVLTASATDIDENEEVTFAVTVEGKPVEADVYVNNQKINSDKHVFTNAGDYEVIAKKNNYKDSDKIIIEVYKIDVYVSGTQNTTANITSTTQALVWKNGELLHELTNGTAFATTAGIALHNDDVYVGGTETSGLNRVAKYWKNNTAHNLTDGSKSAIVDDIAVDHVGNVYVIGTDNNPHKPVLWRNAVAHAVAATNNNRYARAIACSGSDLYIVGNSGSYANNPSVAILWKNSQEIHLTNGAKAGRAFNVAVENGDIYVLGDEKSKGPNEPGGQQIGRYWKNGETVLLDEDPTTYVGLVGGDITVQDGEVYVCGAWGDGTTTDLVAVVWKNGKRLYKLTEGTSNSAAVAIAVGGKDVYTAGYENNSKGKPVVKVWKNDKLLYALTDGDRRALPSGIAVKRTK